jgi:hypothetical protein
MLCIYKRSVLISDSLCTILYTYSIILRLHFFFVVVEEQSSLLFWIFVAFLRFWNEFGKVGCLGIFILLVVLSHSGIIFSQKLFARLLSIWSCKTCSCCFCFQACYFRLYHSFLWCFAFIFVLCFFFSEFLLVKLVLLLLPWLIVRFLFCLLG